MKAAPFVYSAPRSVEEAVELLAASEDARVLAGGQSLVPMLNLRVVAPEHLIDLGNIEELKGIEETGDGISIGAMTTQREIEKSSLLQKRCPLLVEAVRHVGHQQTRNRGTIGGSICHLDPGAELPVAAMALDAVLTVAGPDERRDLPFAEFPVDLLTSVLEPEEMLTRVKVPVLRDREGWAFMEFNRRPADFAIVSVAVRLQLDAGDAVCDACIAVGGVEGIPLRLEDVESALAGHKVSEDLLRDVSRLAGSVPADGDDLYPADYRQELVSVLTRKAIALAERRARGEA